MPINELEKYYGSKIKAEDFNEYWKKQVELIDTESIKYSITEKKTNNKKARYYNLTFNSFDGTEIHAKCICPVKSKRIPVVFEFHDYKERSRSWHYLSRYIGINYAVVAMDCRGQGGLSKDVNIGGGPTVCGHIIQGIDDEVDQMYYRKVYLDAYVLSKLVEKFNYIDNEKMITLGKGQGGAIAAVTAALNNNISKCSVQYPFLSDYKRVWEMDLDSNFYEGIRYYFRWFDSMHKRELEFFEKLSYIDIVNFANMINCEVLLGTGLLDNICPPSSQYAFFNNLNCKKIHKIFHKHGHEINNFFENENLKFLSFR